MILILSSGEIMSDSEDWDLPDLDALMRGEKKHQWLSEPRFEKMFSEIEDGLQGVLGKGTYDWVDRRVFDAVFDKSTLMSLHKLMQKGEIETLDYPIARGKEAHVFHGTSNHGPVAVKIFHTTNAVFKGLAKYIDGDPRFGGLSRRHRELVNIWVRKEFRNLKRMRKYGLRVPKPLSNLKNVLIMEYLGEGEGVSPRLKEVIIDEPYEVFEDLLEFVAINWQTAELVHADFSEYNIFKTNSGLVVFDLGSAVDLRHPNSKEFLKRDINNITRFFKKRGMIVKDPVQVFEDIVNEL